MIRPDQLLRETDRGLWCEPGGFYIDAMRPCDRVIVTHGHADHARAGHHSVGATAETLAIMASRYGQDFCRSQQVWTYGKPQRVGEVDVTLFPAGHVLGSAQVLLDWKGLRITVSGDYKRRRDPTCARFEVVPSHVYVTEATFGLPVFRHPDDAGEIDKLLKSLKRFPDRTHLVGAYALGKAQRIICLLREAGYHEPIFIHGALKQLCQLYIDHGIDLGPLENATIEDGSKRKNDFAGRIVMGPSSSFATQWARRFADPVTAFASGWMQVRARARQRGVELPLIISDHADWDELTRTLCEVNPDEIWVTHGRDDALLRWSELEGYKARPLSLVGFEDEDD